MDETRNNNEKLKERIGVILLFLIILIAGIILIKDKENPIQDNNQTYSSNASKKAPSTNSSSQATSSSQNVKSATTQIQTQKVNINTASLEDLDKLPGIGPVIAQKIIDYRTQKGNFATIENIKDVSGIGEAKYSKIKDLISI